MLPSARDGASPFGRWIILAFVPFYLAAAELGHALSLEPGHFATFWPPAGLLLAALILVPVRLWPGIVFASIAGNLASDVLFHGRSVLVGLGFTAVNLLEAVLTAELLRRMRGPSFRLAGLADLLALLFAAFAGTVAGASAGSSMAALAYKADPLTAWPSWWMADLTGILVVTPLVLTWADREAWPTTRRALEKALLLAVTIGVSVIVFRSEPTMPVTPAFVLPLLLWAAVRFRFRGVGLTLTAFAVVAIGHTVAGVGPIARPPHSQAQQVLLMQAIVALFAVCGLALAAVTAEREKATADLRDANRELEARVRERTAELRASDDRYRAFIANSTEGVWRLEFDPPIDTSLTLEEQVERVFRNGRVAECNDAFARMYGFERAEEVIGVGMDVILPQEQPGARDFVRGVLEAGYRANDIESTERDRYGNTVYFANYLAGEIQNGQLVRVWGTQRDVTARRKAEEELREAGRRKDEFLAVLAHELRNPLAPLRNTLHVLGNAAGDREAVIRAIGLMERQVSHMTRLVDDLLDLARITRGQIPLRTGPLDAADAVRAAVETSRPALDAAGHELIIELPSEPVPIAGDLTRLAQVGSNLLHNAAKYTPRGGRICIALTCENGEAVIRVADNGSGIPQELLPRVWEMFASVNHQLGRPQSGLGIGLSLTKRLVELHNGSVEAHSDGVGRGATFVVKLPLCEPVPEPLPVETPLLCSTRLRVLVVDDNRDSADSLAELVAVHGHDVKVAYDGPSALKEADGFDPGVVLLDIGMPGMSGYEVAVRLRQAPSGQSAVLVAQTGWGQENDRRKSREAGFDHHLTKPIDPSALRAILSAAGGSRIT